MILYLGLGEGEEALRQYNAQRCAQQKPRPAGVDLHEQDSSRGNSLMHARLLIQRMSA